MFTNVIYILFAKGEQLWWDDVKAHGYPEGWAHGDLPVRPVDSEGDKKDKSEKEKK